jgi:L-fuculose-phosphate aldolase
MTKMMFLEARKLLADVGAMMLQRRLTDLAGGNISMRLEDKIIMSPTYAGTKKFWQLEPEEVLVLDLEGNKIDGDGEISRETPTHIKLLKNFWPDGKAVIHAHPHNILVFCATRQTIPPVLEGTQKFGEIQFAKYANGGSHSEKLAANVVEALRGQEKRIAQQAAVVMAPWHGVFAVGKDLHMVLDAIDRIENNAYCILMGKLLLSDPDRLNSHRAALKRAVKGSKGKSNE